MSRWKDFFKGAEGIVGKAVWIVEKAFQEVMKDANLAAKKAKHDAAVAAQQPLVEASGSLWASHRFFSRQLMNK
jgi:hypothetical protein